MDMITKINQLKTQTSNIEIQALCESTISAISSAIYRGVTSDAQLEIERVALTNLFEELEQYTDDKLVEKWLNNQKRIYSVKHLGIRRAVNYLTEKEGKHDPTLLLILERYKERLENDIPEVLLYEDFISAMSSFNHLPAVNTELDAVANRVDQYKNDVDISKIIAIMKETRSSYLIPLIEDVVDDYLNDKSEQSKHFLKETLVKFSYDPFIRDIINILTLDATNLQLEYANAACGIDDNLFSPIIYLGENEALFNVHGTYYVKKGNNINKLKDEEIQKLDESYINMCNLLNNSSVEISRKDIRVYVGNDSAILTESETLINDKNFTEKEINESAEISKWKGNTDFYEIVNTLRENFDEIAELDFVKRVYLKENENYAADVFKLRDNIFITTFDPLNDKVTFYRNINPIQAEKIMMEHMRFDVSKTFEDILPNKEKILSEIETTKKEYSNYINELQTKIKDFEENYKQSDVTEDVINALQEELNEIKTDYKNYLNDVEKFTDVTDENLNITVQDDQTGKSYTVVVPTGAQAAKGTDSDREGAEGDEYGTEVGMSDLPDGGAASAVTFNDDESELLSDEPSRDEDEVDMGADEIEAYADKVDAEAELEEPEAPEEAPEEAGEELGEPEEETTELDLDLEEPEESEEEPEEEPEESIGAPNKELEKTNFNKDKNPNDLDEPKKKKKVYLKRKKK